MRRHIELALAVVGIVLFIGIGWAALIRPQTNQATAAGRRETAAITKADGLRVEIAERQDLQKQAKALDERVKALSKLFPSRPNIAQLTDSLQTIADQTDVTLRSIQPGNPVAGAATDPLARVPVQLTITGGYFQIADFLNRLETLAPTNAAETAPDSRAVLVQGVTVGAGASSSGGTSGAATGDAGDLSATLTMTAFETTQAAAKAASSGATG